MSPFRPHVTLLLVLPLLLGGCSLLVEGEASDAGQPDAEVLGNESCEEDGPFDFCTCEDSPQGFANCEGMVWVPPARFWMGSTIVDSPNVDADELPGAVFDDPTGFFMMHREVSRGEFYAWLNQTRPERWEQYPEEGDANMPMTGVLWDHANRYCQALGTNYNLPTEAQFERAARAACPDEGDCAPTRYPSGDEEPQRPAMRDLVSVFDTETHATRSPLGIYNLVGGAAEWSSDNYYPCRMTAHSQGLDFLGVRVPFAPPSCPQPGVVPATCCEQNDLRVVRGGAASEVSLGEGLEPGASPDTDPIFYRVSNRDARDPGIRHDDVGFRCVRNKP